MVVKTFVQKIRAQLFKTNDVVSLRIVKTLIIKYGLYANIFGWSYSHFFSKSELDIIIVLTRTVNILTTYEFVKLTMLWTTGPSLYWYGSKCQRRRWGNDKAVRYIQNNDRSDTEPFACTYIRTWWSLYAPFALYNRTGVFQKTILKKCIDVQQEEPQTHAQKAYPTK